MRYLPAILALLLATATHGADRWMKTATLVDGAHRLDHDTTGAPTTLPASLTNGLMVWLAYSYDDSGTLYDISPAGNDGTTATATWGATDGGVLCYDGTNDTANLGSVSYLDSTGDLTIAAWLYHDQVTADAWVVEQIGGSTEGILFWRDDVGVARNDCYSCRIEETAGGQNDRIETAQGSSVATTWTHVCVTIDLGSATGLRAYINGVEDANSPVDISLITSRSSGGATCYVGGNGSARQMDGCMDDLMIWTRVLSGPEVAAVKAATQH